MGNPFGPSQEQLAAACRTSTERFHRAVGSLAHGELIFEAPFDLATAAGLAANDTDGPEAVDIEAATRGEVIVHYHVQITQVVDGQPELRRQLVDTVVDQQLLRPLLGDVVRVTTPAEGRHP